MARLGSSSSFDPPVSQMSPLTRDFPSNTLLSKLLRSLACGMASPVCQATPFLTTAHRCLRRPRPLNELSVVFVLGSCFSKRQEPGRGTLDPTRLSISCHHSSTTLQEWDEFSQFNKDRAEAEMKAATELREAIVLTIAEVTRLPAPPVPTCSICCPPAPPAPAQLGAAFDPYEASSTLFPHLQDGPVLRDPPPLSLPSPGSVRPTMNSKPRG